MTKIIKDRGIVLKKKRFRETSKLVTIFSENSGKLNLIAKGVRSLKSKASAVLEPVNLTEFVYYYKHTRDLQYISSAEFVNDYSRIKSDYDKLKYAFAVLDIVNLFSKEGEPNQVLFDMTKDFLDALNDKNLIESALFDYFLIKTSKISGYPVVSFNCPICNNELNLISYEFVFTKDSGVICHKCLWNKNNLIDLNEAEKKVFVDLTLDNLEIFIDRNLQILTKKILYSLIEFLKYHVEEFGRLKSIQMIET